MNTPSSAIGQAGFSAVPDYAELHCRSNFSFGVGASHPEELVERAARLGYRALAITDECSVAGVVRAHEEARRQGEQGLPLQLLIGSVFTLEATGPDAADHPGARLLLLARNRAGYGRLCELITLARSRCEKGAYRLDANDFGPGPIAVPTGSCDEPAEPPEPDPSSWQDLHAIVLPRRHEGPDMLTRQAVWAAGVFGAARASLAVELLMQADDSLAVEHARQASAASGLALVACGAVLMHVRSRKPLLDTLTAIRLNRPLEQCGAELARNAEAHLRARLTLAQLHRPEWLARSVAIAQDCRFSLSELAYEYPDEIIPSGHTPASWLRHETLAGAQRRYPASSHPDGVPAAVMAQIEHELTLVAEMRYEAFFLTVHDVVRYARSRDILCQGRGSAANSAVCYCLGITEVDPTQTTLLFERFISRERGEPPDIDVDFEHERREEVIQYLYAKYGHHRTALAAALATYRVRGAVREVGKALGLDGLLIDAVAKSHQWFDGRESLDARLAEQGLDADAPVTRLWLELAHTLMGFPRHLSQHSGGFVIARGSLARLVPIEPAAMAGRRVIQWDKDDLESLGLLKVDVLALGMLTVLRKALALADARHGRGLPGGAPRWTLQDIPREDDATYRMIQRADTVGMFQIESRAQQSMLPRLKPDKFYDLVIEVAIVRPGPIQGGMVHPYLRRKQGREKAESPYPALDAALKRTLGVPIFQEQVMQVCMIAAGFSPGEADNLRRAMAAWRRKGGVHHFHDRIVDGMVERGYDRAFAEGIFQQIQGFGEYGFPESHAYGFAIITWFSAWLKCHEPAAFLAALLNSQPMGFYGPAQLVADARRHAIEVRPVDVSRSDWDCTLEDASGPSGPSDAPAVRLGLRQVSSLPRASAERLLQARAEAPFADVPDLALRAALAPHELQTLAEADALVALAGHRRQQVWAAAAPLSAPLASPRERHALPAVHLLRDAPVREAQLSLIEAPEGEAVTLDYAATGLSLRRHPLALLRERLQRQSVRSAAELARVPDGRTVRACGLVVTRQQPATAKGTIFVTLEDETGPVNVIVWRDVRERHRQALLGARLLAVRGTWQRRDGVSHLIAQDLHDMSAWLGRLQTHSRDFH